MSQSKLLHPSHIQLTLHSDLPVSERGLPERLFPSGDEFSIKHYGFQSRV